MGHIDESSITPLCHVSVYRSMFLIDAKNIEKPKFTDQNRGLFEIWPVKTES